ncbi:MAG: DUF2892 domain-containing protein [Candidatus Pacebacteria bacterium]|nr:DUF2892 domain-containing protein [Candidatus Paceibacterota bacterium]MCD8508421.1 DUF2892 domain-containing protein [Candidatus Paceibacterota bacterium]MCD8528135.1 DUF2892 domain-containing protein [Candidatus Paceibacterota bacterium]MCD8563505.1 DUF2892 domain-containing protein [Candidatus Paceibacterota bacterium]
MKQNIGKADKIIRIIIGIAIIILFVTGIIQGAIGIALLVLAGMLIITTFTGFCGIYKFFGISTCPVDGK